MEGNTPFALWRCDKCGVELDESDSYIPNQFKGREYCNFCYDKLTAIPCLLCGGKEYMTLDHVIKCSIINPGKNQRALKNYQELIHRYSEVGSQLAQQADLIRRAREVVRTYRGLKKDYNSGGCVCSDCQKLDKKAQALLPDLEAALERVVAWRGAN